MLAFHSYIFIRSILKNSFIPANKLLGSNKLVCINEITVYSFSRRKKMKERDATLSSFKMLASTNYPRPRRRSFNVTGNQRKCKERINVSWLTLNVDHEWCKTMKKKETVCLERKKKYKKTTTGDMPSVRWHNSFINKLWHSFSLPIFLYNVKVLSCFHQQVPLIQVLTF